MLYLVNGFSTGMMGKRSGLWGNKVRFEFETLNPYDAGEMLKTTPFVSCFGHADTAWHLSRYLHVDIPVSRESIVPEAEDLLLVASAKHTRAYHKGFLRCPKWKFYLVRRVE